MRGFVIGDHDMVTGFRLVGIEGIEVTSVNEARQTLMDILSRKDIGIVIVSEEFSTQMRNDIDRVRLERITPLIVEVPGRSEPSGRVRISELISKILGVQM